MKIIYQHTRSILALFALLLLGTSCAKNNETLFDEASSPRLDKAVLEVRQNLISATDGWILEYTPDQQLQLGGYVMLLKFDKDGTVSILNELNPVEGEGSEPTHSDYGFDKDKGVVLTFPSYNDNLHYFADPDINDGYGQGKGFQGDYAFIVSKGASDKEYILKGKYSKNTMRLFQPEGGATAYFNKVREIKDTYQIGELDDLHKDAWTGQLGGKDVELKYDYEFNTLILAHNDPNVDDEVIPYVWTPSGIKLIKPLNGVNALKWDSQELTWTAGNETLTLRDDPHYPAFSKFLGNYLLAYLDVALARQTNYEKGNMVVPVTLEKQKRPGYYITCKGLDYDLTFDYLVDEDAIHVGPQAITKDGKSNMLVVIDKDFAFSTNWDHGFVSVPYHDKDLGDLLIMQDNQKWGKKIDAFLAITPSYGLARDLNPFFFNNLILVKQ